MSNGKLKAQYNRVRTSVALQGNSMWANTIGIENDQAGSNAAIEATLRAPSRGGSHREARQQQAQQLIEKSGYQATVTDYQGLLSLAKAQGSLNHATRGACKICGGLGHLTKQCKNGVSGHTGSMGDLDAQAAAAASAMPLLADPDELSSLSDISSSSSEESSSSSDSEDERRSRKHKDSKKRSKSSGRDKGREKEREKRKSSSRKEKDRKEKKDRHKKSRSHKKARRNSDSD